MPNLVSLALSLASAAFGLPAAPRAPAFVRVPHTDSVRVPAARLDPAVFGRSGALRVMVVDAGQPLHLPLVWEGAAPSSFGYRWQPAEGTGVGSRILGVPATEPATGGVLRAPAERGVWRLALAGQGWENRVDGMAMIIRVPFADKQGAYLNGYHIGRYLVEGTERDDNYAPPAGFIEVTPENQELHVSEHFQLRNFLTKDQRDVWPKYLALDLRLVDKLELVIQELRSMGVRADHIAVMSGFRTPNYNANVGETGGRAKLSRHTYGDASDVWVDNDADGFIDDLNGDGRHDTEDALLMQRAVDRVEARYPELTGGCGVYADNAAHGPFVHIDVRGSRVRW